MKKVEGISELTEGLGANEDEGNMQALAKQDSQISD